jgi:hypothetical protein
MYRARARKRARLDVMMHGIPTSSVAPRGTPSGGLKGGRGGTGVSEIDVDRETASAEHAGKSAGQSDELDEEQVRHRAPKIHQSHQTRLLTQRSTHIWTMPSPLGSL